LLLGLALGLVVVWDKLAPPKQGGASRSVNQVTLDDPEPRIGVQFHDDTMRFGLVMLKATDPRNPDKFKQLTREENGRTNNTCVRVDGREPLFGQQPPGRWGRDKGHLLRKVEEKKPFQRWTSTWEYDDVSFRQTVQIVPNEQTRLLDTCLVHYLIENRGTVQHKVGLRVMLDTYIGTNDGVPFA